MSTSSKTAGSRKGRGKRPVNGSKGNGASHGSNGNGRWANTAACHDERMQELIPSYVEERLGPEQREKVFRHMIGCKPCVLLMVDLRAETEKLMA